ncbi:alkaline phosphatase family protein [Pseudoluteimonas lycopersici]|nr:ectonucleotide pyrophosphatase/phosphodiesterase [Lysobacter lycopersici]
MRIRQAATILLLVSLLAGCAGLRTAPSPASQKTTIVLVSIDALRADALGGGDMPALDAIAANGVHARWMNPSYPTLTFPNHYTLVTGLRPDHHGVVHNQMRDAELGSFVSKQYDTVDAQWWSGGEPLWATMEREGTPTAVLFWPGSAVEIHGERPSQWLPFDKTMTVDARVQQVLDWLDQPVAKRPRFIAAYFDQYDVAAHQCGAHCPDAIAAERAVDDGLAKLRAGIAARSGRQRIDLVVVSDHGMADVANGNIRYLDDIVPADAIDIQDDGPIVLVAPRAGHEAEAMKLVGRHDHSECWRRESLPPAWHYGSNPRIPAIVCQADEGWLLELHGDKPFAQPVKGEHGYAPESPSMHATFVAEGPDFRRGVELPPFDNVDVYPLLTRLLGVPALPNDGDIAPLLPALSR